MEEAIMPASHIEKLVWKFLKENIFGGVKYFFRKETIPLTIYVIALALILKFFQIDKVVIYYQAILLILCGLAFRGKNFGIISGTIIAIALLATTLLANLVNPSSYLPNILVSGEPYLFYSIMFMWTLFTASFFFLQLTSFFYSTIGIFILWGSDKRRLLFTPIPQLLLASTFTFGIYIYYVTGNLSSSLQFLIPTIIMIILIYGVFSKSGRIIRNSLAYFYLMQLFYIYSSFTRNSFGQLAIFNIFFTVLGILFMIQSQTRRLVSKNESKEGLDAIIFVAYGTMLLILPSFLGDRINLVSSIEILWTLNVWASVVAVIVTLVYLKIRGELGKFVARDNFTTKTIITEVSSALGKKFLEEISKYYKPAVDEVLKKTSEIGEELKKSVSKNIDEFVKYLNKKVRDFFKKKK